MLRRTLLAACAIGCVATSASAWNDRGHMIVAAMAWRHLTPQTKKAIKVLLRQNPQYSTWVDGLPSSSRPRAAFIRSATWPDFIKSAHGYYADRLPNSKSARNIGYADCYMHKYWHYKDVPFSPDGTQTAQPGEPNAETQIRLFTASLADPAVSNDVKSYDLAWLLHLVGDVHQPLHATQRFISTDTNGDGGGNDVKYCFSARCSGGSSLHSFWDGAFGNSEDLASVIKFSGEMILPPVDQASDLDPSTWINESFELAKSKVYQPPVDNTLGPIVLTSAYRQEAAIVATQRVSLAGVRLAKILNGANIQVGSEAPVAHTCPSGV